MPRQRHSRREEQTPSIELPKATTRIHSLDSLRAAMMALGILFHGACTYTTLPLAPVWPFKDRATTPVCDVVLVLTHAFRMPLFFLLAGFFANLLFQRAGMADFFRNRGKRILLPFAVGWLLLDAPTVGGMVYGSAIYGPSPGLALKTYFESGAFFHTPTTIHLWFLNYLLYFYVGAVLFALISRAILPISVRQAVGRCFRMLVSSPLRAVIFAVPTAVTLMSSRTGGFDTDTRFVPRLTGVTAYAVFFGLGWLLWDNKDLLPRLQRHAGIQMLFALLLAPVSILSYSRVLRSLPRYEAQAHTLAVITTALVCWLLIFGLIGLAQQYWDQNNARVRYLADASYWMYLAHAHRSLAPSSVGTLEFASTNQVSDCRLGYDGHYTCHL
ncbi:MAG: acyltransferase family protein [Bryobacteraceae bacterium]